MRPQFEPSRSASQSDGLGVGERPARASKAPTSTTEGGNMADHTEHAVEATIQLIEGDEAPPELIITPVASHEDPDHVYSDPEMGDMPDDLPAGSFEADPDDADGADDLPEG